MSRILIIDDVRDIDDVLTDGRAEWNNVSLVKNWEGLVHYLRIHGVPDVIYFDHDMHMSHYTPEEYWFPYEDSLEYQLRECKKDGYAFGSGVDCALILIGYCKSTEASLPVIKCHSANPVGRDWILEEFLACGLEIPEGSDRPSFDSAGTQGDSLEDWIYKSCWRSAKYLTHRIAVEGSLQE